MPTELSQSQQALGSSISSSILSKIQDNIYVNNVEKKNGIRAQSIY
jgi:hypothetical protein